jgi:hypothetical protein
MPVDSGFRLAQVNILVISLNALLQFIIAFPYIFFKVLDEVFFVPLNSIKLYFLSVELMPEGLSVGDILFPDALGHVVASASLQLRHYHVLVGSTLILCLGVPEIVAQKVNIVLIVEICLLFLPMANLLSHVDILLLCKILPEFESVHGIAPDQMELLLSIYWVKIIQIDICLAITRINPIA